MSDKQDYIPRKFNATALAEVVRTADREFLLDLQIALCHYHERVTKAIGESTDMALSSAYARTLIRVTECHDMIADTPQVRNNEPPPTPAL